MSSNSIDELLLQAAGFEKEQWKFGFDNLIYKDPQNTYVVNEKTGLAWFHYRQNEPLSPLSQRYIG